MSWIDVPDEAPQQRPMSTRADQITAAAAIYGATQLHAIRRMQEQQHHWAEVHHMLSTGWTQTEVDNEFARREIMAQAERMKRGAYVVQLALAAVCVIIGAICLVYAADVSSPEYAQEMGTNGDSSGYTAFGVFFLIAVVPCVVWAVYAGKAKMRKAAAWREAALDSLTASSR